MQPITCLLQDQILREQPDFILALPASRPCVVAAAAQYSHAKGIWMLANAARELPDMHFVFLGGDEHTRKRLRESVPLGPNIELAGFVAAHEKAVALHAADLFAMPEVLGDDGCFVPFDDVEALVRTLEATTRRGCPIDSCGS